MDLQEDPYYPRKPARCSPWFCCLTLATPNLMTGSYETALVTVGVDRRVLSVLFTYCCRRMKAYISSTGFQKTSFSGTKHA